MSVRIGESEDMSCFVFFFKQKTAYEMRISDWSSDVCSSDLLPGRADAVGLGGMSSAGRLVPARLPFDVACLLAVTGLSCLRSEERRVGQECVSTCRSRLSTYQ